MSFFLLVVESLCADNDSNFEEELSTMQWIILSASARILERAKPADPVTIELSNDRQKILLFAIHSKMFVWNH